MANNRQDDSQIGNCTLVNEFEEGRWSIENCDSTYYYSCERVPGTKSHCIFFL